MATTKEILKAVKKLEEDRKSDELCNPETREQEYLEQAVALGDHLAELLDNCPKCSEKIFSYRIYKEVNAWYSEFKSVYEAYKFISLVRNLDKLD